jgi:hypothetical protein
MENQYRLFLKRIFIFSLLVGVLMFVGSIFLESKWVSTSWPFVLVFFLAFTVIMHRQLIKSAAVDSKKFIFTFLLMTTVKILIYLAIIVFYVMINREDALGFILVFFINYLFFTAFELNAVLKIFKKLG